MGRHPAKQFQGLFAHIKAIVAVRYPELVIHEHIADRSLCQMIKRWNTGVSVLSSGMHPRTSATQWKI